MFCLQVLLASVIFLALFGAQIIRNDISRAFITFVFGLLITTILGVVCNTTSATASWVVFGMIALLITLFMVSSASIFPGMKMSSNTINAPVNVPSMCGCAAQQSCDC